MAAIVFKKPSEVAQDYLDTLKSLKPSVDIRRTDSDWWIRSRVVGSVGAGIYADMRKVNDDTFPQSARREAVERHLNTYLNRGFNSAQKSRGVILVSGVTGSVVGAGIPVTYLPSSKSFTVVSSVTLVAPTGLVEIEADLAGQSSNLLSGAEITFDSPPVGVNPAATAFGNISDGRNEETVEEAAAAILTRIQSPVAGGTESDYKQYARQADPSVSDVAVIRYQFGLGTVGLVIAAGTTDIDEAVDNGQPVIQVPSNSLVTQVKNYVDALNPLTDCLYVSPVVEAVQDVEVAVRFSSGNSNTIPVGQSLTQKQLVEREIKRAIYKTPVGGRRLGASGYCVASEIEEVIDIKLSALPYTEGEIPILIDRQVKDLTPTGANRLLLPYQVVIPRNINVVEIV